MMSKSSRTFLLLIIALLVIGYGIGIAGARAVSDKDFVKKAANAGKMEVTLGEIAMKQASSDEVKNFGQRMVNDHNMANQQLLALSEKNDLEVPRDMDREESKTIQKLSNKTGRDFDRDYMKNMVEDHKKDLELFRKMANDGKNPDLKNFAQQQLPILEQHLKMAQDVAQNVREG